jgi:hypothetical protein
MSIYALTLAAALRVACSCLAVSHHCEPMVAAHVPEPLGRTHALKVEVLKVKKFQNPLPQFLPALT